MNFYNDNDPRICSWLRELCEASLIPKGKVDSRDMRKLTASDLRGFTQHHFFCGVGGWPAALALAGWPADRPVWSASLPCQPFSVAGEQKGTNDERDLWPSFLELVREYRPETIFGEQVVSSITVGSAIDIEAVQELRDRKTIIRILQELQGPRPDELQGVRHSQGAAEKTLPSRTERISVQGLEEQEQGLRACSSGKASGQNEGDGIRPDWIGNPEANGQGDLRVDWNSFRPDYAEGLELPELGPNRFIEGLHDGQYQGGFILGERDGKHLGTEQDFADCIGDHIEPGSSIKRILEESCGESNEEAPVWLDRVFDDLESQGYSVGAVVLPACSVGAPHRRYRIFWVANRSSSRRNRPIERPEGDSRDEARLRVPGSNCNVSLSDANQRGFGAGREQQVRFAESSNFSLGEPDRSGSQPGQPTPAGNGHGHSAEPASGELDDSDERGLQIGETHELKANKASELIASSYWSAYNLCHFTDGKIRRIEPGTFPLAPRLPKGLVPLCDPSLSEIQNTSEARSWRLHGYGNSIVPYLAAEFIRAYLEIGA